MTPEAATTSAPPPRSLWRAAAAPIPSDEFAPGAHYDDVVVGAGLTGLVTALLLQRTGRRVLVLEAREVGAVATGNTTAKLSLLQGAHLSLIAGRNIPAVTEAYVAANLAGFRWLLDYCEGAGVPVQRRTAYSYAQTPEGVDAVLKEHATARRFGLATRLVGELDVPFPSTAAVALDDQAQFDPMDVLTALAADFRAAGGTLVQGVRALGMRATAPVQVRTSAGPVTGDRAYLLTGAPILDRGLYFAKLAALRSYAVAFRTDAPIPDGMYLSVDEPSRSVRDAERDGERLLLVGGNGHPVGRRPVTSEAVADLVAWTRRSFPGAEPVAQWSAQDYEPFHRVPFVGWLPRGRGRIFLATGFDKWGMTNAVQAALTLVADLEGETPAWARTLHRRPTLPRVMAEGLGAGLAVGAWCARGWSSALRAPRSAGVVPVEGQGSLARDGLQPVAVSTVEGRRCAVSAVCPHLGGIVTWNDAERSWDCPLHGSRFAADGTVLEGPAVEPLVPLG
ncbi:FAD-dependent oxidoreductase [Rathayibacter sp. AY1B1]|uniref:FAD-dependent oxidoreductase n=1 Tax=unclassified Rathayibacter TaxID=2609250 RepID=UPI000CE81256|nr:MULTISPECIES: FAD-dependent oxidoreductase [unclassified Rathayibacter]PPI21462.1 FAD-dependent oxidoreductase [Rathayibacter sp. AY1B6]PPI39779.1 FAD-dependent oxidoreductase [Rathayibacter sp. AY1B1]